MAAMACPRRIHACPWANTFSFRASAAAPADCRAKATTTCAVPRSTQPISVLIAAFNEEAFRAEFALPPRDPDELLISVFAYPRNRLPELLPALEHSPRPIRLLLAGTEATARRQGSLSVHALPFLPQVRYDEILWAGDLNFVRGEDSFVRAQWAGKPFVWQIYPQAEDAHFTKLDAFLDHHPAGALLRPFWHAWNGRGALDWPAFAALLPTLKAPARRWAQHLRTHPDLAAALVHFCRERLK